MCDIINESIALIHVFNHLSPLWISWMKRCYRAFNIFIVIAFNEDVNLFRSNVGLMSSISTSQIRMTYLNKIHWRTIGWFENWGYISRHQTFWFSFLNRKLQSSKHFSNAYCCINTTHQSKNTNHNWIKCIDYF